MDRGKGLHVRRVSKRATVDGDSEKLIRDECDNLIRDIIKIRDSSCFTCGIPRKWVAVFPGHYITRKVLALRWSLDQVHAQCNLCNSQHNTEPIVYRKALMKEYDEAFVLQLEFIAQQNPRVEYTDLLAIRDGLRSELQRMI